MAAAAILDFENFTFLTVGTVKSAEIAKFCRNRSNRGGDITIFGFFKMEPPLSWILKFFNF